LAHEEEKTDGNLALGAPLTPGEACTSELRLSAVVLWQAFC